MDRQTALIARRLAKDLKKGMKVDRLILFGSRARGDHFATSDFDFILVSDDFSGVPFVRRAASVYKLWHHNLDLEMLCYTRDEWRRLKNKRGILLNAQRDGLRIA